MTTTTTSADTNKQNPCCLKCNAAFNYQRFHECVGRWPDDGDMIMCTHCGEIFRCGKGSTIIEAPIEFIATYEHLHPEPMAALRKAQQVIREAYINKQNNNT
jgi:hypothetical protein